MNSSMSEHEKIFDEICGKLNDLSFRQEVRSTTDLRSERMEIMQNNLKRSQEELKQAYLDIQEKIKNLDNLSFINQEDKNIELQKMYEQLDQERSNNSRLSGELNKSLELNLKLQFEIEEIRTKSSLSLTEEKRLQQQLSDKNKFLTNELELAQALCDDSKLELLKAKEKFQLDSQSWKDEKESLELRMNELFQTMEIKNNEIEIVQHVLNDKELEIKKLSESLNEFESHILKQEETMRDLAQIAEKKIIELKFSFDKKSIECQDYYSHLQHALTQINVLKQENLTLKEYLSKYTHLHQTLENQNSLTDISVYENIPLQNEASM